MYTIFKKINSKGFTIVEIIASIAILGMVIAVLLPIFPQVMNWSKKVDDELGASNLLEQAANDITISTIRNSLGSIPMCSSNNTLALYDVSSYPLNDNVYSVDLNVCKEGIAGGEISFNDIELYRANIQILSQDKLISESYTYIKGEENEDL
ncbi:type II secretion system protein [Virgibacillus sp. C22-A2]|uniref:Type II secretion system protein n=1 Tax=Virgibacillus tibetensis TaxID=3042313 RepID=A0ABU6K9C4_9BACI|nr:type II secretion system protein [Virgibacillus sp. C22-A2]